MLMGEDARELPYVLCCMCGIRMQPNQANTCAKCLQSKFDVTESIAKSVILFRCKGCERFQRDGTGWIICHPESRELLALCLKRVTGLKTVKLVDACFLWTEPHSKRIKVRIKVQKEVINGVILEESCVIEFILQSRMCDECHRIESNKTWSSVVQVRQKVQHKRTFLLLEQLIIKHKEYQRTIKIESMPDGVDFYFAARNDAVHFLSFLESVVPVRCKTSKHLITSDAKSNSAMFNHTFCVELVPLCKDDLICLPPKLANKIGGINQFVLCTGISSNLKLIDPASCHFAELTSEKYWQNQFKAISSSTNCVEFTVLDVQPYQQEDQVDSTQYPRMNIKNKRKATAIDKPKNYLRGLSKHHSLSTVEVARTDDLGMNDRRVTVLSHLGNILKPGDSVLGYDLATSNVIDTADLKLNRYTQIPEVILVRKHFPLWRKSQKKRKWKLKTLGVNDAAPAAEASKDTELLMRDIEEDENIRSQVNLYKSKVQPESEHDPTIEIEEDVPEVNVESILDDFDKATIQS